jgi:hypothetical protein
MNDAKKVIARAMKPVRGVRQEVEALLPRPEPP